VKNNPEPQPQTLRRAVELLRNARCGVALTGAGVSTPSGIPDFRSPHSGLWENVDPMEVASIYGFRRKPEAFFAWMRPLAQHMLDAKPNPAHVALAKMEALGYVKALITQNIDMLHSRAGSHTLVEVHGHMREATCGACFRIYPTEPFIHEFISSGVPPCCPECGGILKPNVVLFGEQLPFKVLQEAQRLSADCDVMLVAGSSLSVAPVSDFPRIALAHGAKVIIVNYEQTYLDRQASVVIHDDVAVILPRLVGLLEGKENDQS
jgi:NAD-dependent deacetylase